MGYSNEYKWGYVTAVLEMSDEIEIEVLEMFRDLYNESHPTYHYGMTEGEKDATV